MCQSVFDTIASEGTPLEAFPIMDSAVARTSGAVAGRSTLSLPSADWNAKEYYVRDLTPTVYGGLDSRADVAWMTFQMPFLTRSPGTASADFMASIKRGAPFEAHETVSQRRTPGPCRNNTRT